jgi:hypothetical protein
MTNHRVFTFQTNKARPAAVSVQQIATRLHECGCFCLSTDAGCSYICDCEHNAQPWEKKKRMHTGCRVQPYIHVSDSFHVSIYKDPTVHV